MATIFVDESGYTGPRLLDPAAPVFVLAAHDFDESESRKIKNEFFRGCQAGSLKYINLYRKDKWQAAIKAFLVETLSHHSHRIRVHAVHKRFAIICKLVDHLVETAMDERGIDLYDQGQNLALSNAVYYLASLDGGEEYFNRLLKAGQALFLDKSFNICELLWVLEEKTGLMYGPPKSGGLANALSIMQSAILDLDPDYLLSLGRKDVVVEFASAVHIMSDWRDVHGADLDVIHDQSSAMLKKYDDWCKYTSPKNPKAHVGMDRRTIQFPIGVKSTRFEPDEKWAGLQLADIIASATSRALSHIGGVAADAPTQFEKDLIEIIGQLKLGNTVWPEPKFTPKALGTCGPKFGDVFDYLTTHVIRQPM